jgi:DNA-directed RNA polymerase specialized sigma24 family protein
MLGSDASAKDITQEVFVKLWEQPERFDQARGSLPSFLLSIATTEPSIELTSIPEHVVDR